MTVEQEARVPLVAVVAGLSPKIKMPLEAKLRLIAFLEVRGGNDAEIFDRACENALRERSEYVDTCDFVAFDDLTNWCAASRSWNHSLFFIVPDMFLCHREPIADC